MEHSFSQFVYLDTCIFSHVTKTLSLWRPLQDFLVANDLTLAVTGAHLLELSRATALHDDLTALLVGLPSAAIKPEEDVLREEIAAHPHKRMDSLLLCPLNQELLVPGGLERLRAQLRSPMLQNHWPTHKKLSSMLPERWEQIKDNYPPGPTGRYTKDQALEFATFLTYQKLASVDLEFLTSFKERIQELDATVFRSVMIRGLVTFYKYYLDQRTPNDRSDLGDLMHLYPIPYCRLAVFERDLCSTLRKVAGNDEILSSTRIDNIDFFKSWRL